MNTKPSNILPLEVRHCGMLSTIQMFFEFIDRRHYMKALTESSIETAESYLAEIRHYTDMCTQYEHLQPSVDIAQRYFSVATMLVKQMKGEL